MIRREKQKGYDEYAQGRKEDLIKKKKSAEGACPLERGNRGGAGAVCRELLYGAEISNT
jgi:hypothetical protein